MICKPNVKLETFEFDFDYSYDKAKFAKLETFMAQVAKEREISILVNNFGKMNAGLFETMEYAAIVEMINANINSMTFMTRFLLQNMNHQGTKSAVINVSSGSASQVRFNGNLNFHKYQVFQATQSYQTSLTASLQKENPNVDFLNDIPLTFNVYKKNLDDLGYKVTPENHVD